MIKKLLLTLALALALALSLGIAACGTNQKAEGGKFGSLNTAKEIYGFSAASAGTLISAMNEGGSAAKLMSVKAYTEVSDDETIAMLDNYMRLVESLLSEGSFQISQSESDRKEYAVKETVSYKDMLGNKVEYVLYYNETELPADRDDDDDDDEDDERNYSIAGVMVVDGTDYAIVGEKETEQEEGETESESKFTVALSEGKELVVKQELEREGRETENKFVYSLYENGVLVEKSSFEYENEENETEIEFTMFKDGKTQIFYFEEEKGAIEIKIGDKNGAAKYRVRIVEDENGSRYVYETKTGK